MPSSFSPRPLAHALLCVLSLAMAPLSQAQPPADAASPPSSAATEDQTTSQDQTAGEGEMTLGDEQSLPATNPQPVGQDESVPGSQPQVLEPEPLGAIAARLKKPLPLKDGRVVVLKSQHILQLFDGTTLLKSYSVSLGPNPSGPKAKRGDGRTPEGEYFICTRNAKTSAFHIFLGLSYPALPDAQRGAKSKIITPREMQIIRSRLASRSAPPWNTKLGGWVGIHGGSDAPFANRVRTKRGSLDWTAGCVAVSNAEIEEISSALNVGARVSIRP